MQSRAMAGAIFFASLGGFIFNVHAADAAALQFVNSDLQLGVLTNGQDVSMTFALTNTSDKVVKISNVDTSCHCTSVEKSPDEIPAHGNGAMEVNFNLSRSDGPVTQSIVVETADGQILTGQFSATVGSMPTAAAICAVDSGSWQRHLSKSSAVCRLLGPGCHPRRR